MALSTYLSQYIISLSPPSPCIVGVIGSGGKTSIIELLASTLVEMGKRVLIITTTHMGHPDIHHYPFEIYIAENEEVEIGEKWLAHHSLLVASVHGDKIGPIRDELYHSLLPHYDIILVEADGARRKNLKYHRDNEPVLIHLPHLLIKMIGLSSYNNMIEEELHNANLFFREHPWQETLVEAELIHYLAFTKKGLDIEAGQKKTLLLYNQSDALNNSQLETLLEKGSPYFKNVSYPIIVGSIHTDTIEFIKE